MSKEQTEEQTLDLGLVEDKPVFDLPCPDQWVKRGRPGFIDPGTDMHRALISPSKVAAIMGVSRWESAYRLWHRMKGILDPEPPRDRFMVGHAMELAAAHMYKEDHPAWRVSPGEVQFQTGRFGFPAIATLDRRVTKGGGRSKQQRVLEIKTTESLEDWGDSLTDEAPADYLVQLITLMGFSGLTDNPAHLMLLGPRISQRHEYEITFAPDLFYDWIIPECNQFWDSLESTEPPPLDNSVATYECVREMHPDIDKCVHMLDEKGKPKLCCGVEVDQPFIVELRDAKEMVDHWKTVERGLKTKLLDIMGRYQHARIDNTIVARRQRGTGGSVALVVLSTELPDEESLPTG